MSPNSSRFTQEIGRSAASIVLPSLLILLLFSTFMHAASPVSGATSDRGNIQISGNLAPAAVLKPYNAVLSVTGGQSPYRFSVSAGQLPNGLGLNPLTGSITGAALLSGSYGFTVAVSDHTGASGQRALTLLVSGSPKPGEISVSVTPTTGTVSSGGSQQFTATVTGTSQTGVTWVASAGTISSAGLFTAPTVTANTNVKVTATSTANPAKKGSATFTVTAPGGPPPIQVSVSPASGSVSSGGTQQFTATVTGTSQTGVTWVASAGTINSAGLFTAPTVTANTNVTIIATSLANPASKGTAGVTVTLASGPPPTLAISTTVIPSATAGSPYIATLAATGGTLPYTWSLSGTLPTGIQFNSSNATLSGTSNQQGQFPVVAKVTDAASNTASQPLTLSVATQQPGAYDGPAELPRVYVQSLLANTPAPGTTVSVPSGGSLQAALNSANCGDTIALQAGATFSGIFTFPAKPCDAQHWIIVRTSAPDTALPPEGVRITPCFAGVASLPGRPPFNCTSTTNVMARLVIPLQGSGPVVLAPGAHYYRLLGLEITRSANGQIVNALATPAAGAATDHIVYDRVWIHGTAQDETAHGVRLGGSQYVAVVDSFFTDMHCVAITGACTDSQAVSGGTGSLPMGPYKIVDNFLEAAGENILFGGGAAILTPADIEIRRNHFFKPMTWMQGQPNFVGGTSGHPFIVKNLFEVKNAQRVLLEANIMENAWGGFSQTGFGIVLTPKSQGGLCPLCQVTDITIRYGTLSHVAGGLTMGNGLSDTGAAALAGERYSIHDITVDDISGQKYYGNGVLARTSMGGTGSPVLQNVQINHISGFASNNMLGVGIQTQGKQMLNIVITNNIMLAGNYPVWSTGGTGNCAYPNKPLLVFNACFNPYVFAKNVIIATPANTPITMWPVGTLFATLPTTVGFVNYNNGVGGDYRLLPTSPYHNAASDGKDIGADVTAINAAIGGVY